MGTFSRNTFDRLNHYVGVRLQQGVPILDADWNEQDEIQKHELKTFLKWFIGNGVPYGNDGFAIGTNAAENDFGIAEGRCLVEGWDVINDWPEAHKGEALTYTRQPLFGNDALAARWGVTPLAPLSTPTEDRIDTVYLDVWERQVDAREDGALINPFIGIATSLRIKREWVVRVAEGTTELPSPPSDHVFYPIARLTRTEGAATIGPEDLQDLRRVGLQIMSYFDIQQVVGDVFGTGYTLDRDAQPNLKMSLRETLNALLRHDMPGLSPQQLTDNGTRKYNPEAVQDRDGDFWVFWRELTDGYYNIWYKHYDQADGTWSKNKPIIKDSASYYDPSAVEDNDGNIWVFWHGGSPFYDIWYDRFDRAAGTWDGPLQLTGDSPSDYLPFAMKDSVGDLWVFWHSYRQGNGDIWCQRYDYAAGNWMPQMKVSSDNGYDYSVAAVEDLDGDLWAFWHSSQNGGYDIYCARYDRSTNSWQAEVRLTSNASNDSYPYAAVDGDGDLWVFWETPRSGNTDIYYKRHDRSTGFWSGDVQLTLDTSSDNDPFVVKDGDGGLWVFWQSYRNGKGDIWYKRYTRELGWSAASQLSFGAGHSYRVCALADHAGDVWAFWEHQDGGEYDIWYRKLLPSL